MAPQPVSREGSVASGRRRSDRNSSSTSRTNCFSDDYALDSPGSVGDITPVDSIQESVDIRVEPRANTSIEYTRTVPRSDLPTLRANIQPSSSTSEPPRRTDSAAAAHHPTLSLAPSDSATTRSFSTSSRLSILRPYSPYNGPTAPSQPYAMYPQVTRASSIASESTVRPMEGPFVSQGGPEHPYAMYQNTVPEEDDESSPSIPLAFPGATSSFQGSRSSGNDTGDIVGTDGHVETLPPYTRYADNSIAKGDMAEIDSPQTVVLETESTPIDHPTDRSTSELTPMGVEAVEDAEARKEGWRTRAKRRKCCGIPCWMALAVLAVVVIAAAAGGIIGGVIGNKQGVKHAENVLAQSYYDASPVASETSTPPCPTGHFTMLLSQTNQVEDCITDPDMREAGSWDCMDVSALGVSIFDEGPEWPPQVVFDDYSNRPQLFRYGPQPPDFNRNDFNLTSVVDKDDDEYGVAMWFGTAFDKIVILQEDQITSEMAQKRSLPLGQLSQRGWPPAQFGYLAIGESPWYCFWNQTVGEFWIFLEKEWDGSSASSTTAAAMSMVTPTPSYPPTSGYGISFTPEQSLTATTTMAGGDPNAAPTSAPTWDGHKRRGFPAIGSSPDFPKFVKMVEKRKPQFNIQPYCQQMEVKANWQIVPKQDVPTVCIEETEYAPPKPTGNDKRWAGRFPKRAADSVNQMESMCICEWESREQW